MVFIRSTLFNFFFFGTTAIACVLCLPGLLLPKKQALYIVDFFVGTVYFLERVFLGLDYEVRGLENLPKSGAYIVAAKHQSAYETMKLHILFRDPAVILKRELLRIPLWGMFLAKTEPIAIDRSSGREATTQIIEGARRVQAQGRPIIIFPQGTRVYSWQTPQDKPYKSGVIRMHETTGMPVIPLALNTGLFWPRSSWLKYPGKVIFEFLPALPDAKDTSSTLKLLQETLETTTGSLEKESLARHPFLRPPERKKA